MNTYFSNHPQMKEIWAGIQPEVAHIPENNIHVVAQFINKCTFENYAPEQLTDFLRSMIWNCCQHPILHRLLTDCAHTPFVDSFKMVLNPALPSQAQFTRPIDSSDILVVSRQATTPHIYHELKHALWGEKYHSLGLTADGIVLHALNEAEAFAYSFLIAQNFPGQEKIAEATSKAWKENQSAFHDFLRMNQFYPTTMPEYTFLTHLYAESLEIALYRDLLMAEKSEITSVLRRHNIRLPKENVESIVHINQAWKESYYPLWEQFVLPYNEKLDATVVALHKERTLKETGVSYNLKNGLHFLYDLKRRGKARCLPKDFQSIGQHFDWHNPIQLIQKIPYRVATGEEQINGQTVTAGDIILPANNQIVSKEDFNLAFHRFSETICGFTQQQPQICVQAKSDVYLKGVLKCKAGDYLCVNDLFTQSNKHTPHKERIETLTSYTFETLNQHFEIYNQFWRSLTRGPFAQRTTGRRTQNSKTEPLTIGSKQPER